MTRRLFQLSDAGIVVEDHGRTVVVREFDTDKGLLPGERLEPAEVARLAVALLGWLAARELRAGPGSDHDARPWAIAHGWAEGAAK